MLTCSGVMPEKQNMPICSVMWSHLWELPSDSRLSFRDCLTLMMRSAMPLTSCRMQLELHKKVSICNVGSWRRSQMYCTAAVVQSESFTKRSTAALDAIREIRTSVHSCNGCDHEASQNCAQGVWQVKSLMHCAKKAVCTESMAAMQTSSSC